MTFVSSVDVKLIAERLASSEAGDFITYEALAGVISATVREGRGASSLSTARRRLQRDKQIVFGVERGRGLRRLSDEQVVAAGAGYVDKVRRTARRGAKLVTAVKDFAALPDHARIQHNAQLSVFSAIEAVATHDAVRKIGSATGAAKPLPIAATLDAFRIGLGGKKPAEAA